ncbi:MAG: ATP-binding cassette domain-containing protein [Syntrophorhabdaceae bacterium]|nr:ATP-binding cassette domain-containing protein [Syntrophorhabdaceae bacterium]
MARVIIEVVGLTAGFGDDIILRDLNFKVYEGEIFVIVGGSGCGKSTLLKHLIGLHEVKSGRILLFGKDITTAREEELMRLKQEMGVLFQTSALFGSMTLYENIALPLQEFTTLSQDTIDMLVKIKLAMVGLEGYENHFPNELSGGMKKRAGIARAMALDPSILFLDEPSAGLDPVTSAELDGLIKKINRGTGTTMVIVTHELESIFSISDRIIMLDKSKKGIIAEGRPKELKMYSPDPKVLNFFNRGAISEASRKGYKG